MTSSTVLMKGIVATCSIAGIVAFSLPAHAQSFTAAGGIATADFTAGAGTLSIVLTSNIVNAPDIGHLLSDLSFSVSGGQSISTTDVSPSGSTVVCSDNTGCVAGGAANPWVYGNNTGGIGTGAYLLTGLRGTNTTNRSLILGPTTSTYCIPDKCPDGIHNLINQPYLQPSGSFLLTIAGVTAGSIVSDVAFSFGTTPETVVGVPIPAAAWLFGSGLLGLIGVARRRITGANAPAVA